VNVTPFQMRCAEALMSEPNGIASATAISNRIRKTVPLAVSSALRALHRRGLANCFPSDSSEWSVTLWTMTAAGKAELQLRRTTGE
jgi:hypothetical protein